MSRITERISEWHNGRWIRITEDSDKNKGKRTKRQEPRSKRQEI